MLFLGKVLMYLRIHDLNLFYKIVLLYVKIFTWRFSLPMLLVNRNLKRPSTLNIQLTFDSIKHASNCSYTESR